VVRPGDEVVSLPSGQQTTVERVHTFDGDIAFASPTRAVTLCLAGELDISRGDMLAHPRNTPRVERTIEAMLVWMDQTPLREGRTYLVKHATRLVKGIVSRLQYRVDPNELHREAASELRLNEIGRVDLELLRPILCDAYQRNRTTGSFVLIDPDTHATAAAGMIIERAQHGETRPRDQTRPRSANITRESGFLDADERASLFGHGAATVWLTGLSGVGKSTIARLLERRLFEERCASYVLDGDNVRHGLSRDLGFDLADRSENVRRVAEVARLMTDAGQIVVTSFISPLREDRDQARQTIGAARFFEVFLDAPLDVCEQRDPKGLYRRARAGEIPGFTGVSSPYEPPQSADLRIDTSACPPEQAVDRIVDLLRQRGVLPAAPGAQ
jgi:bifunctional enzyme CysN/CysC